MRWILHEVWTFPKNILITYVTREHWRVGGYTIYDSTNAELILRGEMPVVWDSIEEMIDDFIKHDRHSKRLINMMTKQLHKQANYIELIYLEDIS